MKATDLMIGDWVLDNGTPTRMTLALMIYDIGLYQPIPLTPEILEKNGFVSDFEGDMFWESESTYFALQKGVDGRNRWWWEVYNSPFLPLNYVHELQHFLKDCKIDKEIVV